MKSPQDLLDDLHTINIHSVWDSNITSEERSARIKRTRLKLITVRQSLQRTQEDIKRRYGSHDTTHVTLAPTLLAPYDVIEQLINTLENDINQIQRANNSGFPLPDAPIFGKVFFGGPGYGSYLVATIEDLKDIQKRLHRKTTSLTQKLKTLEAQKDLLSGGRVSRGIVAFIYKIAPFYKSMIGISAILILAEVVFLFAALRGFSPRPKAANTDASVIAFAMLSLTICLVGIPGALMAYLLSKTQPTPETQSEIKDIDFQISETTEMYKTAQKFYDEAKAGLKRITERKAVKQ